MWGWKFHHIYWITIFASVGWGSELFLSFLELISNRDKLFHSSEYSRLTFLICFRLIFLCFFIFAQISFVISARKANEEHLFLSGIAIFIGQYVRLYIVFLHTKWTLSLKNPSAFGLIQANPAAIAIFQFFFVGVLVMRISWILEFGKRHSFFKIGIVHGLKWISFRTIICISGTVYFLNAGQVAIILTRRFANSTRLLSSDFWIFNYPWIIVFLLVTASSILYVTDIWYGIYRKSQKLIKRFYNFQMLSTPPLFIFDTITSFPEMSDTTTAGVTMGMHMKLVISMYVYWMCVMNFMYYAYLENTKNSDTDADQNKVGVVKGLKSRKIAAIPECLIKVVKSEPIGSGYFSSVYEGCLLKRKVFRSENLPVAVKVLLVKGDNFNITSILEELQSMSRISVGHKNVVKFFGVCLHSNEKTDLFGKVSIILELCENGSLIKYLRGLKPIDGIQNVRRETIKQLFLWAKDVAMGMEYLSSLQIIHGDLAGRNVLLDSNLSAKISDFGMSRKLYEYEAYITHNNQVFPWKWMAPESLDTLKFSLETDVWSFGVLLWEIFTLGSDPYPGMEWRSDFVSGLKNGESLGEPQLAPPHFYDQVVLKCWSLDPALRPKFGKILAFLDAAMLQIDSN